MQEFPQIKGDSHAMDPQLVLPRKTEPDVVYTKPSQIQSHLQQQHMQLQCQQ